MNYHQIYTDFMSSRQKMNRTKGVGIFERHHIIPKCFGGTDSQDNLVLLTPKEHFIAHQILVKMYTGIKRSKMCYALSIMQGPNHKGRIISARQFDYVRKLCIGLDNGMLGKKHTH